MTRYYLHLSGEEKGPYTLYQLRGMWSAGTITMETLYRLDDDGNWLPLSMIVDTLEKREQRLSRADLEDTVFDVAVNDVDMKFDSMVFFMVKWVVASIPAFLILTAIFGAVYYCALLLFVKILTH